MNFFEWDKEKWEERFVEFGCFTPAIIMIMLFFFVPSSISNNSFLRILFGTVVIVACVSIIYLFLRLLRYLYLFFTGQLWKSKNTFWALSAVKRIKDQDKLKKVVIEAAYCICKAAWEKITDFDQEFLKEVAVKASHSDVRIAAASKLFEIDHDDTCLKTIIFELGAKLKNSENADAKREATHYLHSIYKQRQNSNIGENIRSYNGVLIDAGSEHIDYHTDYYEEGVHGGWFCDANATIHTDSHTDIQGKPSKYFCE
jgi:hypothetical protein